MITRDEMKLIKSSKKYLSWLFEDDSLLIDSPVLVNLPEGELKLANLLNLRKTKIQDIIQEIPDSFNEEYKEPEPVFMKMKPCCKHCKKPLNQDDQDYEVYEEELDDSGEMEVKKIEGKTIDEVIVDMELCCNTCMTRIHNEAYGKGLCYICYDEGRETAGNVVVGEDKTLYCEDCK